MAACCPPPWLAMRRPSWAPRTSSPLTAGFGTKDNEELLRTAGVKRISLPYIPVTSNCADSVSSGHCWTAGHLHTPEKRRV